MGATNMNETMLKGASYVSFAENNHYQELLVSTSSWSNKSAVTELFSVNFTTKNVLRATSHKEVALVLQTCWVWLQILP